MATAIKNSLSLRLVLITVLLLLPPVYLVLINQGVGDIVRSSAPDGQLFYIISRLLGLYALIVLCWQVVSALLEKAGILTPVANGVKRHIITGGALLLLILLHSGLFVTAVSVRSGALALGVLLPNFNTGYYNTAVSLGVLALLLALVGAAAGLLRKRFVKHWKYVHVLMFAVFVLVFAHAWMIGSDVQAFILKPLFWLAGVSVVAVLTVRLLKRYAAKDHTRAMS